jgi:hypothetical protein
MTELRKRMIECLQLRGLSARTQDMYVRAVRHLAERQLRARYKQAFLGVAWAIIPPVVMTVVLSLFVRLDFNGRRHRCFFFIRLCKSERFVPVHFTKCVICPGKNPSCLLALFGNRDARINQLNSRFQLGYLKWQFGIPGGLQEAHYTVRSIEADQHLITHLPLVGFFPQDVGNFFDLHNVIRMGPSLLITEQETEEEEQHEIPHRLSFRDQIA